VSDTSQSSEESGLVPQSAAALVATALVAFIFFVYRATFSHGLVGADSFPILEGAHIASFSEFLDGFTEIYMDGRFPHHFYPPSLNQLFGLEYALFGLEPLGYQVLNVAALAFATVSIFLLARRLSPRGLTWPAAIAALSFASFPAIAESLPALARRHDNLCGGLMALSLLLHLRPGALAARWGSPALGLLALFAMGVKEAAFVLPALATVTVAAVSSAPSLPARVGHGLRASAFSWAALALAISARLLVIGHMGGFPESGLGNLLPSLGLVLRDLVEPDPLLQTSALVYALGLPFFAALLISLAARLRADGPLSARCAHWWVALAWLAANAGLAAYVGRNNPWQNTLPAAGMALVLACALELPRALPVELRCGLLALLLVLPARHLSRTPLFDEHDRWSEIEAYDQLILTELERKLPDAPRDQLMFAPPMTHASRDYLDEFGRPSGILRGYSILAWIELRFPGLPVVFVREGLEGEAPTDHVWICFKNTD